MNFFDKFVKGPGNDTIEFMCHPDFKGIIPEPQQSKKYIPDWFKQLQPKIKDPDTQGPGRNKSSTIKRCPPFLDAMSVGWLIPLVGDVSIKTNEDASYIEYDWRFPQNLIENHSMEQIKGHPGLPKPPIKFINHWHVKVPPGWSVMFVPPLNRPNPHFECLSGIVDCDGYFERVNFPAMFNTPNYEGVIEAGTPLVQAIPFKRKDLNIKSNIRAYTDEELGQLRETSLRLNVHESHYRDNVWTKK